MKKITIIAVAMMLFVALLTAQGPKQVYIQLFDEDGVSNPNPENGKVTFEAWITARPDYVLTHESVGCRAYLYEPAFYVLTNAGNFPGSAGSPADWSPGEILRVEVHQGPNLYASKEVEISFGSGPQFFNDENGMVLGAPPTVLFDSDDEGMVTTTADMMDGFNPGTEGEFRANGWDEDLYWGIQFSTMGYDKVRVTSRLRRQYAGPSPNSPRGPKYFQTYFSIDNGENWIFWGNPDQGEDEEFHELPNSEEWLPMTINLPSAAGWQENIIVIWKNVWDETNQDGWAEIKNVRATAEESDQPSYKLYPPNNLAYELQGNNVNLTWKEPAPYEELKYDNDDATGSYYFPGSTMSTRMTPSRKAQILTLRYYTATEEGSSHFNAEIYGWTNNRPSTQQIYSKKVSALQDEWVDVDVSSEEIYVTSHFIVGFGSINETAKIAFDEDLDNGRSWDFDIEENTWYQHNEAYLIRAVVLYEDGETAELMASSNGFTRASQKARDIVNPRGVRRGSASINTDNLALNRESSIYRNDIEVIGYNVYRDDERVNDEMIADKNYADVVELQPGVAHTYYVTAIYTYLMESTPSLNSVKVGLVGVEDNDVAPVLVTQLNRNYPNPFNPTTTISFSIANDDNVKLEIFNSKGQKVTTLVNDYLHAGHHSFVWQGRDSNNREVSSGIYFYRLNKSDWSSTQKMLLVK